jgi:hypothetical protein
MFAEKNNNLINLVKELSNNFTTIIPKNMIDQYSELKWGNNGIGDRWAKKLFNYSVITNKKIKTYSENDEDINEALIRLFQNDNIGNGIIGILVHSIKINKPSNRPIKKKYNDHCKLLPCVICGSTSDLIVDHKNDLYNDTNVLNTKDQKQDDFQTLCNHCNLQKRQVCKKEKETGLIYSALNIPMFQIFKDEFFVNDNKFDWENSVIDMKDIDCKNGSFWYDPIKFMQNIKNSYVQKIKLLEEEIIKLKYDDTIDKLNDLSI